MKMIYSGNDRAHALAGFTLIEVMIAIVYFHDNRKYGSSGTGCGVPVASSNSVYFNFTCYLASDPSVTTQTDDQSYVVHAIGVGAMAEYEYTTDHVGAKQTRNFVGAAGLPVACWMLRAQAAC